MQQTIRLGNSRGRRLGLWWICAAMLCATDFGCVTPRSEAQNFRGGLVGFVDDATGGRISNASIGVQAVEATSVQRDTTSDRDGQFRIDDLPPGVYRLSVKAKGFADAFSDVTVVVSTVKEVTITLHPAAIKQTVNVQGQESSITTQPINTTSAVHQTAISAQDLETIPRSPQFRQHRISSARNGAGRALGSNEGTHNGPVDGRQLRAEQRAVGGWRRQLR